METEKLLSPRIQGYEEVLSNNELKFVLIE
jgi:hypothetical protein